MNVKELNDKYTKSAITKDYMLVLQSLVDKWKQEMFPDLKEWEFNIYNNYNDEGDYYNDAEYFGSFALGDWVLSFDSTFEDYSCSCDVDNENIYWKNVSKEKKNSSKKIEVCKADLQDLEIQISKILESIELLNSLKVETTELKENLAKLSSKKQKIEKKIKSQTESFNDRKLSEEEISYFNNVIIKDIENLSAIELPLTMLVAGCDETDITLNIQPSKSKK